MDIKLGNIVLSPHRLYENKNIFGELNQYDFNESIVHKNLPTLYVGYKQTKELFGKNFNILTNKITNNIYWTPSILENKNDFIKGLSKFKDELSTFYKKTIKYRFINLFSDLDYGIKLFNELKNYECFELDNVILFYKDRVVYGFDIRQFSYVKQDNLLVGLNKMQFDEKIYDYYLNILDYNYIFVPFINHLKKIYGCVN